MNEPASTLHASIVEAALIWTAAVGREANEEARARCYELAVKKSALVQHHPELVPHVMAHVLAEEVRALRAERQRLCATVRHQDEILTELRAACHLFIEARKHGGYGIEDAERAIRAALTLSNGLDQPRGK